MAVAATPIFGSGICSIPRALSERRSTRSSRPAFSRAVLTCFLDLLDRVPELFPHIALLPRPGLNVRAWLPEPAGGVRRGHDFGIDDLLSARTIIESFVRPFIVQRLPGAVPVNFIHAIPPSTAQPRPSLFRIFRFQINHPSPLKTLYVNIINH